MELKLVLLNYLRDKEGKWTRLEFYINDADHFQSNDNMVGLLPIVSFTNKDIFNQLNEKMIGKSIIGRFKQRMDFKNPLDTKNVLSELEYEGHVISLL